MKAVIFDMDGVISDTQTLVSQVESKLFAKYGIMISADEITRRFAGTADHEFFHVIFTENGTKHDVAEAIKERQKLVMQASHIAEIKGAVDLIKRLHANGFKLAIASGSSHEFINLVTTNLDVKKYFSIIASVNDVGVGKPDPAVFLYAAKKLCVAPEECVVIEDSIQGIIAAKKANMKVIGLTTENFPADLVVTSLKDITVSTINAL